MPAHRSPFRKLPLLLVVGVSAVVAVVCRHGAAAPSAPPAAHRFTPRWARAVTDGLPPVPRAMETLCDGAATAPASAPSPSSSPSDGTGGDPSPGETVRLTFSPPGCCITGAAPPPADWRTIIAQRVRRTPLRRVALHAPGAVALRVRLRRLNLPEGGVLIIAGKTPPPPGAPLPEFHAGRGPFGDGELWSGVIPGDTVLLTWTGPSGSPPFEVAEVSCFCEDHLIGDAGDGNALCFGGDEIRSVVRLVFQTAHGPKMCTGVLVVTPAQDAAPLVVTAAHCIASEAEARSVQAFWFYHPQRCQPPVGVVGGSAAPTGARLIACSEESDQSVLEILGKTPEGLCYSGWTAVAPPDGTPVVGLHHPWSGAPLVNPEVSWLRAAVGKVDYGLRRHSIWFRSPAEFPVLWLRGGCAPGSSGSGLWVASGGRRYLAATLIGGGVVVGSPEPDGFDWRRVNRYTLFSAFAYDAVVNYTAQARTAAAVLAQRRRRPLAHPQRLTGLTLTRHDPHWFKLTPPPDRTVVVEVFAPRLFGGVTPALYESSADGELRPVPGVRRESSPNGERLTFSARGPVWLKIALYDDTRAQYDLEVDWRASDGGAGATSSDNQSSPAS